MGKCWSKIDATYAPIKENTFTACQTLRKQTIALVKTYADAESDVSKDNNTLTTPKVQLQNESQAWYKAATKASKVGTPKATSSARTCPPSPQPAAPPPCRRHRPHRHPARRPTLPPKP